MKKGEITAFLSLIFVLLISFIGAMVESASLQAAKNWRRADVDKAVYSVFGEYRKELLEEYELFAVEESYESGQFNEVNLLTRLEYYGAGGMENRLEKLQLLTDNQGYPFREQVVTYMKDYSGISIAEDVLGMSGKWEEQETGGERYEESEAENSQALEDTLTENETQLPETDNPLQTVSAAKSHGVLNMVLSDPQQVSNKAVRLESMPSNRSLHSGRGAFQVEKNTEGTVSNLLFGEYLLRKFSMATQPNEDGALSYELEYLIGGKGSDRENLEYVVKRLLWMRTGANYLYLMTDMQKQAEAEAMAAALASLAALPVVTELVKQALLAAWAYGESVMDLRSLLQGKKVVLVKTAESWQLQLSALGKLGTPEDAGDGADMEGGLEYKEYLRMLLFLGNKDSCSMRALDLIEKNMQQSKGLTFFKVDYCVTKIQVKSIVSLRRGITYEFPTYFAYR